jgi:hypothetical protein
MPLAVLNNAYRESRYICMMVWSVPGRRSTGLRRCGKHQLFAIHIVHHPLNLALVRIRPDAGFPKGYLEGFTAMAWSVRRDLDETWILDIPSVSFVVPQTNHGDSVPLDFFLSTTTYSMTSLGLLVPSTICPLGVIFVKLCRQILIRFQPFINSAVRE